MSDGTKSGYTKTGKKVKCINCSKIDLIYKKVYDVLLDVKTSRAGHVISCLKMGGPSSKAKYY